MSELERMVVPPDYAPIKSAFPHEAMHLTPWLANEIDCLAEILGISLTVEDTEKPVGDFKVDIYCKDPYGNGVIIENQVEKSNHDHMGKLLTYLVNLDAKTAIWITPHPRKEHQTVMDWLNEISGEDYSFYLVKLEVLQVDENRYIPIFSKLAGPSVQSKKIGEAKKVWAETEHQKFNFWSGLLEESKALHGLFRNISPQERGWIGATAGRSGLGYNFVIWQDACAVELYIDFGKEIIEINYAVFDALFEHRTEVENDFGDKLDWERLEGKQATRIRRKYNVGGFANPDMWSDLQKLMAQSMLKFEKALKPHIEALKIN